MPMRQPNDPLRGFRVVQSQFDAQTVRILQQAAKDIRTRIAALPSGIGGEVRAAQLRVVLNEIAQINKGLWTHDLLDHIQVGKGTAATRAQQALETLNRVLTSALPPRAAQAVSDSLRATARAGIAADMARVPRDLSGRVWKNNALATGKINDLIRSGLVQGLSAKELAQTVYKFASPLTPGGQSYAAMRLARTEINNAFHNQQRAGGSQIGVLGTKWNLSDSHPDPDECDEYAAHDVGKLGRGVWKSDSVPDKPHPHCFCYLTYVTLTPKQFADAMLSGQFDDEIDRRVKQTLQTTRR